MTTNFKRSPPVIKGIITQVSIPIKKIHNKNKCRSVIWILLIIYGTHNQGRFPHEIESPLPLHFKHSSLVEKGELVQVRFTQRLRDQRRMCMEDGCIVYMDSYMASNGSCFMVSIIIFKNHLLEVGLTQNHQETMALKMLTTVGLFYYIMCEEPHEQKFTEIAFG